MIFSLPEGYNGKDGSSFCLHVYIALLCYTIAQILYKVVCKQYQSYCEHLHMYSVFTVLATRDKSGGM